MPRDKAQQAPGGRHPRRLGVRSYVRAWLGRPGRGRDGTRAQTLADPLSGGALDVRAALQALPAALDGAELPNGVVELVIEEGDASARCLFDIHDRHFTPVEPGSRVPWASIAGSPRAWALALEAGGNASALQLTGEEHLAQRVLAALPERRAPGGRPDYSVPNCS